MSFRSRGRILLAGMAGSALALAPLSPTAAADVDRAPIGYLQGPDALLLGVGSLTLDANGDRYLTASTGKSVTVHAAGATGNASPERRLVGAATTFDGPRGVAVDAAGRIYVSDVAGADTAKVAVFAPGADGNVAPERTITGNLTGLDFVDGLGLDSGGRLYVANRDSDSVAVFAPGATGNVSPLRTIAGPATGLDDPRDILVEPDGTLHVVSQGNERLLTFAPGASGNVAPLRSIAGPATTLSTPRGLARDGRGNLYIGSQDTPAIAVFAAGASGDVAPVVRLVGPQTDLGATAGVGVDAAHRVVVANSDAATLTTYAPLVALPRPGAVSGLKVTGKASAPKRTVVWKAPTTAVPVTGYRVIVRKGATVVLTRTVSGTRTTLRAAKLRTGRHTVSVTARNAGGTGPVRSTSFSVAK